MSKVTPGFLSSTARSAQFGSVRRRVPEIAVVLGIARSTVQDNLQRAAAVGLSWPPELVPLPASRSICLNCLMVSLLFAGIKMSPVHREVIDAKVADPGGNLQCRNLAGF